MKVGKFLFGTLRGRLILSVAIVHAVMMSIFIIDSVMRQRDALLNQQITDAKSLSQTLSNSAAGWISTHDISGLQELVENQSSYPQLKYAILTDQYGLVLAHTDRTKIGKHIIDLPKEASLKVLNESHELVDVVAPAVLNNILVGWVRIGLDQEETEKQLSKIIIDGLIYTLLAIIIGSLIAWFMGKRITERLYLVQNVMNKVSKGDSSVRAHVTGSDEANLLAKEFNSMLDTSNCLKTLFFHSVQ
ncbi:HAMP domain-containing protein [Lutibacter sp.]|uniref:HAMP domain-containing protein n=1 Tax=Lutibacter sp. TaxID=1925666 RepID=UPI002734413E|nr:HAMP domain-containing protein [Lutibacter sp.]MDP3312949.1 HAMP domain-containing protein [Lutibacter sp.]